MFSVFAPFGFVFLLWGLFLQFQRAFTASAPGGICDKFLSQIAASSSLTVEVALLTADILVPSVIDREGIHYGSDAVDVSGYACIEITHLRTPSISLPGGSGCNVLFSSPQFL